MLKRNFKFRAGQSEDQKGLAGYAFRFSEVVTFLGQKERFSPELEIEDNELGTYLFRDHDPGKVLARVPHNLRFETDKEGLLFKVDFIETELW